MAPQQAQPEEDTASNGALVSYAWQLGRTLQEIDAAQVEKLIPLAKEQKLDEMAIKLLEILHATLQMYDQFGLRAQQAKRNAFYKTDLSTPA